MTKFNDDDIVKMDLESLLSELKSVKEREKNITKRILELAIPLLNEFSKSRSLIYHFDYHKGYLAIKETKNGDFLISYDEGYKGMSWEVKFSDLKS